MFLLHMGDQRIGELVGIAAREDLLAAWAPHGEVVHVHQCRSVHTNGARENVLIVRVSGLVSWRRKDATAGGCGGHAPDQECDVSGHR